ELGQKYRDPVLVASTDSVGTKGKLAALLGRYEGVGHDLVNHRVNDILTTGAEPLFFLDYIGNCGLSDDAKVALVRGVAEACREAGCALVGGGLTSNVPGILPDGLGGRTNRAARRVTPVSRLLQDRPGIDEAEMYRAFTTGIGLVLAVDAQDADAAIARLSNAWVCGQLVA